MADAAGPGLVMLFDGDCGVCNAGVRRLLRLDPAGALMFAPLSGAFAHGVRARHPWLGGVDSVVVVERLPGGAERVYAHSDAVLRLARTLHGWRRLALFGYAVPAPIRDALYRLFARHRLRFFGRHEGCLVPTPAVRARFLDAG